MNSGLSKKNKKQKACVVIDAGFCCISVVGGLLFIKN